MIGLASHHAWVIVLLAVVALLGACARSTSPADPGPWWQPLVGQAAPAAAASADAPPARVRNAADGSEMIWIPPGEVRVGSRPGDAHARPDEKPARRVRVERGFYVARFEVSNEQYERFVQATGHRPPNSSMAKDNWPGGTCPAEKRKLPVTHVSWDDARAYCRWAGGRLPTEIEWEYCARGSTEWSYPFGDTFLPELANCDTGGERAILPVGSKPKGASPFGVEDLAGNAWEWIEDAYDELRWEKIADGPAPGPQLDGQLKVLKGGAYTLDPKLARISARDRTNPEAMGFQIGFRLVHDR